MLATLFLAVLTVIDSRGADVDRPEGGQRAVRRVLNFRDSRDARAATSPSGDPIVFQLRTGTPGQSVYLASELYGWAEDQIRMEEVAPGTYRAGIETPWRFFLQYKFVVDGAWQADPENPSQVSDGFGGWNSVLEIEGFSEDPRLEELPGAVEVTTRLLQAKDGTGKVREMTLLIPRAKSPGREMLLVFQDGGDYLERASARNLIANLSRLDRVYGLFVPPRDRMAEYALGEEGERYADFLADVAIPLAERAANLDLQREDRFLVGPSLGGLASVAAALRRPDVFGGAISQSGSLWWEEGKIIESLRGYVGQPLRLFLDVGAYEVPNMTRFNRLARDAARGNERIELRYAEYPSTHDWIGWRNRLAEQVIWAIAE